LSCNALSAAELSANQVSCGYTTINGTGDYGAYITLSSGGPSIYTIVDDTPESGITAVPGSLCVVMGTSGNLYIKTTGTGNTGWKLVNHA